MVCGRSGGSRILTNVPRIKECEDGTNGEKIVKLRKGRHLDRSVLVEGPDGLAGRLLDDCKMLGTKCTLYSSQHFTRAMLTILTPETTQMPRLGHNPINRSGRPMCAAVHCPKQVGAVQKWVKPVQERAESPWPLGIAGDLAFQTIARIAKD